MDTGFFQLYNRSRCMKVVVFNTYRCRKKVLAVILISLMIIVYIHYHALRSYVIMFPYSYYHSQQSLLKKNDYLIRTPSHNGFITDSWYPGMLVFHDEYGFEKWVDEPVELTVLYRFGGFKFGSDYSTYYDHTSDRFSSFYGAYIVDNKIDTDTTYGFNEEQEVVISEIMSIPEYDQRWLVMPSIGLSPDHVIFEVEIVDVVNDLNYASESGLKWSKVDAHIITNSPQHLYQNHQRGYLQYGVPKTPPDGLNDYYPISLAGRIYVTKNDTDNTLIALYILAVDFETVDEIDNQILSNTTISKQ